MSVEIEGRLTVGAEHRFKDGYEVLLLIPTIYWNDEIVWMGEAVPNSSQAEENATQTAADHCHAMLTKLFSGG
jgi:hypothetical protein